MRNLIILFYLVLILTIFYWIHKPVSVAAAEAVATSSAALLTGVVMMTISGGLGRTLLRRWYPGWREALSVPEQLSGEALLGTGLLSVLILIVGVAWLHTLSMVLLLLLIAILTVRDLIGWIIAFWLWVKSWSLRSSWERWLAYFIAANLVMMIIMALAPPTRFDALTYHLVGPKLWAQEHRFMSLPDNHFFAFPQGAHTLYAAHIAILGGQFNGTAILHTLAGLLTLIGVGGYATRRYNAWVGLTAVTFMVATTSLWYLLTTPYVDAFVMAFATFSFIMLDQWRTSRPLSTSETSPPTPSPLVERGRGGEVWLILAGIFAGLALSVKYEASVLLLPTGVYFLVYGWRDGLPTLIRRGLIFGIVALVVMAPWLIRTGIFYDNPIYPFGPPAGQWDELSSEFYFRGTPGWWADNWWQFALLPFTATMIGIEGAGGFDFTPTPLLLMLVPLLAITWRSQDDEERQTSRSLFLIVLSGMLAWLLVTLVSEYAQYTRRHLYLLPWLAVLAAVSLERMKTLPIKPFHIAFIARALVGLVLVMTLINHISGTRRKSSDVGLQNTTLFSHFLESRAQEYILGVTDEETYLEHNLGTYALAMQEINQLPEGSHVLFLWETRSLYCDETRLTCEEDTILMRWWYDRRTVGDGSAAEIVNHWRERGVTHVLVWDTGREHEFEVTWIIEPEDEQEWEAVPPLLELIWEGGDIDLYQIPAEQ